MPLRRWMALHGHPGWYSWLVVIAGCLISMAVSITISNRASDEALERDRAQREAAAREDAQRRAENRRASCALIRRINDAYADQGDGLSPAGKDVAKAWADLARLCR